MSTPGLVDCHLHLQDYDPGTDIDSLIAEAESLGVTHFVCNGDGEYDWQQVLDLSRAHSNVIPCFGVHPWFVDRRSDEWLSVLEGFLRETPSGVGEIGLDHLHEPVDAVAQEEVFRAQLDLARRYERPAMIHCVRAWGQLMDVLRDEDPLPAGILLHAYGGSADLVKPLADMGAYFSIAGNMLNDKYKRGHESLAVIPRDRMLVETDAPALRPPALYRSYSVPTSDGGEYNHPANLPAILHGIAGLLGEDEESLRARLWENTRRFLSPIRTLP